MDACYRTVFVSDVHLGTRDCRADYLLDFLRTMRCRTLYLVGDIVDLEAMRRRSHWPASHAAVVAELQGIAARGTRVVYIPGNHDAPLRRLAGQTISGIEVKLADDHVAADGRRYRVSHGDEFDQEHDRRRLLVRIGERAHALVCAMNRACNAVRRAFVLPYVPLTIIAKRRIGAARRYIQDFERRVALHAADHGYDGHICGHIHYGGIQRIGTAVYANLGDWVEHCTALTEDADGTFELLHWTERRTALARADGLGAAAEVVPLRPAA